MVYKIIETPALSVAEHVSYDINGNPIYFDGLEYWVVLKDGKIEWLENR